MVPTIGDVDSAGSVTVVVAMAAVVIVAAALVLAVVSMARAMIRSTEWIFFRDITQTHKGRQQTQNT